MLLPARDQYHVGIVVDDFEGARNFLAETSGYVWGNEMRLEYTMLLPDGPFTCEHRLVYSVTEPRLELIRSIPGTPMQPSSSGLHHFGYWCRDVGATSAALRAKGWTWECGGTMPDGSPAWAYHHNPGSVRIELVSSEMKAGLESLWTLAGDGAAG